MKKILIFSFSYYPLVGGAEVAVKEITDRIGRGEFSSKGGPAFSWDMITMRFDRDTPKFEKIGNINVYRLSCFSKYFFPVSSFSKAVLLHRKNSYNIIWSIMANYAGFGALLFKFFNPRVRYVLTLQEGDPIEYIKKRVRFVYPLFVRIFTKADMVQAISNYLARFAREMGFKGPLEVIPNGVDVKKFRNPADAEALTGEHESRITNHGNKILITISRLVKKNGIEDIIKSLRYLPDNIHLWILGIGPLERRLKLQVKSCKLKDRVKFFGHIDYSELPNYLAQADIFVRPSLSEGMGNSFIEAMAAGVPVIGTSVGGIVDFLKDGETGLFCEVEKPESIAKQVKKLLEDKELRERIAGNAKELVNNKYDWNLIAKNMREKVFEKISNSPNF